MTPPPSPSQARRSSSHLSASAARKLAALCQRQYGHLLDRDRIATDPVRFWLAGVAEYERFVRIMVEADDLGLPHGHSPSAAVDLVWHAHLTDTAGYRDYIAAVAQRDDAVLHHSPYAAADASATKLARYRQTYAELSDVSRRQTFWWPPPDQYDDADWDRPGAVYDTAGHGLQGRV